MTADLTVPPPMMPEPAAYCEPHNADNESAFAWPGLARQERHCTPLYTAEQIDAINAIWSQRVASLQAELKQGREVAAFMHAATREAQAFAADAQDKAASPQARLEAAERDAARYRWLREHCQASVEDTFECGFTLPTSYALTFVWERWKWEDGKQVERAGLDAAIDAAKGD